jgi:DNA ligase-1
MKQFAALFRCLDESTKTNRKIECLREYFTSASPADAAWAVYFLTGRKPKRLIRTSDLRTWAASAADIAPWLFAECHATVGDLAETIALLLDEPTSTTNRPLYAWVEEDLLALAGREPFVQRRRIVASWHEMGYTERLVWNKMLTGEFRVGVSQTLVVRALAEVAGVPPAVVAHRLMGNWNPSAEFFRSLVAAETHDADLSRPYPFCLAYPLEERPEFLGDVSAWQAEWKWDGIRAQIIRRQGALAIWSRGEDLINERFPELASAAMRVPDGTVLDGEIVAWRGEQVMGFGHLQRRIGRKQLTAKMLASIPARFIAFDLLEHSGEDIRSRPLSQRRSLLEGLLPPGGSPLILSPIEPAASWGELAARREESRERHVEGLMLKLRSSPYAVGRTKGLWWKWKVDPHTVDAVLVYAQLGSGRRAGLYTDYTFALWSGDELVPFAKAYSGLTDAEIREVDRFVRQNAVNKFGPVRSVEPTLVFEIGFERMQLSKRHKSGVAVRFPRILRWRKDKIAAQADTLESIRASLAPPAPRDLFSELED